MGSQPWGLSCKPPGMACRHSPDCQLTMLATPICRGSRSVVIFTAAVYLVDADDWIGFAQLSSNLTGVGRRVSYRSSVQLGLSATGKPLSAARTLVLHATPHSPSLATTIKEHLSAPSR